MRAGLVLEPYETGIKLPSFSLISALQLRDTALK